MEQTYSVIPILRTESRLQGKRATVMIRITVGGQRELSLKRKVEANRVKGTKEDVREINALIETYLVKVNRIHRTLLNQLSAPTMLHDLSSFVELPRSTFIAAIRT